MATSTPAISSSTPWGRGGQASSAKRTTTRPNTSRARSKIASVGLTTGVAPKGRIPLCMAEGTRLQTLCRRHSSGACPTDTGNQSSSTEGRFGLLTLPTPTTALRSDVVSNSLETGSRSCYRTRFVARISRASGGCTRMRQSRTVRMERELVSIMLATRIRFRC